MVQKEVNEKSTDRKSDGKSRIQSHGSESAATAAMVLSAFNLLNSKPSHQNYENDEEDDDEYYGNEYNETQAFRSGQYAVEQEQARRTHFVPHQIQLPNLKSKYFESPITQAQIQYDCSAPIARNTPENNQVKLIDYRQAKIASFRVDGKELICLPQAFEVFLKNLVGGLHTVYTKLKRLDIVPVVCNVEQVNLLKNLQFLSIFLLGISG